MLNRRDFLALAGLAASAMTGAGMTWAADAPQANKSKDSTFADKLAAVEAGVGGRLGVHILEADSTRQWGYRADERFPMCSTFKFLAAAAVLNRVDQRKEKLSRHIVYGKEMLVPYSPTTEKHAGTGMAMAALCEAAMTLSDNTAANLMLESMGGPAGLTDFVRTLGDKQTRLDRNEPTLNEAVPGDPRDTTTPESMTADLAKIVLGSALSTASRKQITDWLIRNKTGDKRVRAGLPQGWKIGDKTGTGRLGTTNTVGVIWPPQGKPLLFAVYLTECKAEEAQRNAVHAEVGKLIAQGLA